MEIDLELTEKLVKHTQRWWKLTPTICHITIEWHMGKARDFKNRVTAAVFPFVVTVTYV